MRYHLERHHKGKPIETAADVKNDDKGLLLSQETGFSPVAGGASETKNLKRLLDDAKEANGSPPAKQQKEVPSSFLIPPGSGLSIMKSVTQDTNNGTDLKEGLLVPDPEKLKSGKKIMEPQANDHAVDQTEQKPASPEGVLSIGALRGKTNAALLREVPENAKCRLNAQEKPLNLSTGSPLNASVISLSRGSLATRTCPFCTYRTLYPEVLTMHQRLKHKYNPDTINKNGIRNRAAIKARRTGCPPFLLGKDVLPLPLNPGKAKPSQSKPLLMEKVKQSSTQQSKPPVASGLNASSPTPSNLKSCKPQIVGVQGHSFRQQHEMQHTLSGALVQDREKRLDSKPRVFASPLGVASSNINGSLETSLNKAAWSSNRGVEFLRNKPAGNMNLEFDGLDGPPSKRTRPNLLASEQMNASLYRRGSDTSRLHVTGRYASLLPQGCSHTQPASSFLPAKPGFVSSEVDAINPVTILKPYETYGPGPFYSRSSSNQVPSSSKEGRHALTLFKNTHTRTHNCFLLSNNVVVASLVLRLWKHCMAACCKTNGSWLHVLLCFPCLSSSADLVNPSTSSNNRLHSLDKSSKLSFMHTTVVLDATI